MSCEIQTLIVTLILAMIQHTHGIQLSFIPSPNITILQSAVYQCTVDGVGPSDSVSVQWVVNSISSSSPSWPSYASNYSIVVDGIGTHSSTLTIPGDTALNGTTVQCIAAGIVNGEAYLNTGSDTLYVQGEPGSVALQCVLFSLYTIKCNWSIPYTLPGVDITGYNINITNGTSDNLIMNTTVNETQYTYSVSKFGVYNISVAAVIGDDLEGKTDSDKKNVLKVPITNYLILVKNITKSGVNVDLTISLRDPVVHCPVKITLFTESPFGTNEYIATNINVFNNLISGSLNLKNMGKREKTNVLVVVIEYDNGLQIRSNQKKEISTFDVQMVHVTDNSNTTGEVCFECEYGSFVSNPTGCYIQYNCTEIELRGSVNVNYQSTKECRMNIPESVYNVSGYDIQNDNFYLFEPAYIIIGTQFGLTSTRIPSHSASYSTNIVTSTETTVTSTVNVNENKKTQISYEIIAGIVVIIAVIVILLMAITLLAFIILSKKTRQHKKPLSTKAAVHYIETEVNANGPTPSLVTNNTLFPYTSVESNSTQQEDAVYNKLHREGGPINKTPAHASFEQYSTLLENGQNDENKKYSTLPGQVSNQLTYKFMVDNIISKIPHKWKEFGEHLAIIPPKLEEIGKNHPYSDRDKFCDIIQEWQTSITTKPFTQRTLREVLKSIEENELMESCL